MRYHARDMAVVRAREAKIPIVLASATPSVETDVNARARALRATCTCPSGSAASTCRRSRRSIFAARRSAARALHLAAARRSGQDRAGTQRAGAAVPQSPRLCAADAMQRLRYRLACPNCDAWLVDHRFRRRLVCHHCGYRDAAAGAMPEVRGEGQLRRGRSRGRAAGAGGGRAVSRRAHPGALQRPGRHASSACARNSMRWRRAASTSSSAPSLSPRAIISPSSIWSASSMPISGLPTAIRARRSARSNCCIRWSAAPAARRAAASAICRRISPSIR